MADVIELTGFVRVIEVRMAPAPPITPIVVDEGEEPGEATPPPPNPVTATINLGNRELQVVLPEGSTATAGDLVTVTVAIAGQADPD